MKGGAFGVYNLVQNASKKTNLVLKRGGTGESKFAIRPSQARLHTMRQAWIAKMEGDV